MEVDHGFVPLDGDTQSCVLNCIAYLKGLGAVPEDWMIDEINLHELGKYIFLQNM